jgi:N-acetylglutamate synthase-like GNAT family acetyltransferase
VQKFYQAQIEKNNELADSIQYKIDNLLKRRYLYTINFAANNTDENIAPYLALTRVFDANLALLDSIAVKMTPEVRESKYGKELVSFLEKRKAQED